MAETTDQVRAEIAATRDQLGATIDELIGEMDSRVAVARRGINRAKRGIPFWGMGRRQAATVVGASAGVVLLAFAALAARKNGTF